MNQPTASTAPADAAAERKGLAWLVPLAGLVALVGYFGPWIDHPVAGLTVTGLDLAEYVKFLPAVRAGELVVWREGFYLPLVAVSLTWSLSAFRSELGYGWLLRGLLLAGASSAALNLLPPAWTPALLGTPEFRGQTAVMLFCLGVVLISPFAALLPRRVTGGVILALAAWSLWTPARGFLHVLPDISLVYNATQRPGWGMFVMLAGLAGLLAAGIVLAGPERRTGER